jgi:two-component system OmpR family response regulator
MHVLVAEDEIRMAELLRRALVEEGHQVVLTNNGREALAIGLASSFDVIVLDVMMPGVDGFSVARRLRESKVQTPILMLTARDAAADIIKGLDSGADDYLTKPFSVEVLLARLRAVSRRGAIPQSTILEVADVRLDPANNQVTRGGTPLNLTPREYRLLELLMRNKGRTVSRDAIFASVWGVGTEVTQNTLEVFISMLRLKVDCREPKLIHTVRGFGYVMREHV